MLHETSRSAFEGILEKLQDAKITLLHRRDNTLIDALEEKITEATAICNQITRWENRWAQQNLVENKSEFVSDRLKANFKLACKMNHDEYRSALIIRDIAQHCHGAVANLADAAITLSCPGPAPIWKGDNQSLPLTDRLTGDAIFNYPSSMLFAPCVTLPLISVNGLPVGVQVMGQPHQDFRVTAIARRVFGNISPIAIAWFFRMQIQFRKSMPHILFLMLRSSLRALFVEPPAKTDFHLSTLNQQVYSI